MTKLHSKLAQAELKEKAIEFQNVSKEYPLPKGGNFKALKAFNLTVHNGEFFGLLGHNGAGKTTAINILAGINPPTQGDVLIHGTSVLTLPEITKRSIGVVQQELVVDSFFNLTTMLKIQSKLYGVVPDMNWIELLLDKLQLSEHRKKTTRQLSGGMKRRMMIARALVHKPAVLILDEPTAGVDVQLRLSMWEFIRELHESGVTIILTTHYLEEAENFCSRIGIMKNGELVTLKKNQDILSLGGKPKLCFKINLNSENKSDDILTELKKAIDIEGVQVKLVTEMLIGQEKKIEISAPMSYEELGFVTLFIDKISQVLKTHNLTIETFFTQQPSLEEVFIKINDGKIESKLD